MHNSTFSAKPDAKRLTAKPRQRKCCVCKEPFLKQRMGQVACGPYCAAIAGNQATVKDDRKADQTRKEALKTRSDRMKEAQIAFNALRREVCRQAGYLCICCDQPLDWTGNNVDNGHYRSVGSAPHLRFNPNNSWAQRKQCNRYGAGRAVDYRIGLIKRIGLEAVEALESDNEPRKWTIPELIAIKVECRAKLRELKKAGE
jgi:hypothetical protein